MVGMGASHARVAILKIYSERKQARSSTTYNAITIHSAGSMLSFLFVLFCINQSAWYKNTPGYNEPFITDLHGDLTPFWECSNGPMIATWSQFVHMRSFWQYFSNNAR